MNETDRFWTPQNVFILFGLLIAQVFLFCILIKNDTPGPLSGLAIFFWIGGTAAAIIFHIILLITSSRKSLFGIALLICVLFWTTAWSSYNYLQRTSNRRERIKISDGYLKEQASGKIQVELLLRKKTLCISGCRIVFVIKYTAKTAPCYYLTPGGANGEGITTFETMAACPGLEDTSTWLRD